MQDYNYGALYKVSNEYMPADFFIKLDATKLTIDFYKNANEESCYTIDLNDLDKKIDIPWVHHTVLFATIINAAKATRSNNFPEYISYSA